MNNGVKFVVKIFYLFILLILLISVTEAYECTARDGTKYSSPNSNFRCPDGTCFYNQLYLDLDCTGAVSSNLQFKNGAGNSGGVIYPGTAFEIIEDLDSEGYGTGNGLFMIFAGDALATQIDVVGDVEVVSRTTSSVTFKASIGTYELLDSTTFNKRIGGEDTTMIRNTPFTLVVKANPDARAFTVCQNDCSDADGDGWGYENGQSCKFVSGITAACNSGGTVGSGGTGGTEGNNGGGSSGGGSSGGGTGGTGIDLPASDIGNNNAEGICRYIGCKKEGATGCLASKGSDGKISQLNRAVKCVISSKCGNTKQWSYDSVNDAKCAGKQYALPSYKSSLQCTLTQCSILQEELRGVSDGSLAKFLSLQMSFKDPSNEISYNDAILKLEEILKESDIDPHTKAEVYLSMAEYYLALSYLSQKTDIGLNKDIYILTPSQVMYGKILFINEHLMLLKGTDNKYYQIALSKLLSDSTISLGDSKYFAPTNGLQTVKIIPSLSFRKTEYNPYDVLYARWGESIPEGTSLSKRYRDNAKADYVYVNSIAGLPDTYYATADFPLGRLYYEDREFDKAQNTYALLTYLSDNQVNSKAYAAKAAVDLMQTDVTGLVNFKIALQDLQSSINKDPGNLDARNLRLSLEKQIISSISAGLRKDMIGLQDNFLSKVGTEKIGIVEGVKQVFGNSANVVFVELSQQETGTTIYNIEFEGKSMDVDFQQGALVALRAVINSGVTVSEYYSKSSEQKKMLLQQALFPNGGHGEQVEAFYNKVDWVLSANSDILILKENGVGAGHFNFQTGTGYVNSDILKTNWYDYVLGEVNLLNVVLFAGPAATVRGVTIAEWLTADGAFMQTALTKAKPTATAGELLATERASQNAAQRLETIFSEVQQKPASEMLSTSRVLRGNTPDLELVDNEAVNSFYVVVGPNDEPRFLVGNGRPFPIEPEKANVGRGMYAWDDYESAIAYRSQLDPEGTANLRVMQVTFDKDTLQSFKTLDLVPLSDAERELWHQRYAALYAKSKDQELARVLMPLHGYDHIIRPDIFDIPQIDGTFVSHSTKEHFFNIESFDQAKLIVIPQSILPLLFSLL